MKSAIIGSALLLLILAATGCSHSAQGVKKDAHSDVKWIGHHV